MHIPELEQRVIGKLHQRIPTYPNEHQHKSMYNLKNIGISWYVGYAEYIRIPWAVLLYAMIHCDTLVLWVCWKMSQYIDVYCIMLGYAGTLGMLEYIGIYWGILHYIEIHWGQVSTRSIDLLISSSLKWWTIMIFIRHIK